MRGHKNKTCASSSSIVPFAMRRNTSTIVRQVLRRGRKHAIIAPGQGFFPKLDYGLFSSNLTKMVINGGLGESVLPIRFYNRPEIVLITLETG
ncbi:MAG: hypothetical protein APF76_03630 [Desulfitibacter sp. BRH_c19]|nr:MAG: hypothetical protein APF76_03630 [Desulfitibacter sp. BRH_c19]